MSPIDVRLVDGELDEVVAHHARVHLERMDRHHWWLAIETGKETVIVHLYGRRRVTVDARVERER